MKRPIEYFLTTYDRRFYFTNTWRKMRAKILEAQNNECQLCKERGKVSIATVVHHMVEYRHDPSRALDPSNLQALCDKCHNDIHERVFKKKELPERFQERW